MPCARAVRRTIERTLLVKLRHGMSHAVEKLELDECMSTTQIPMISAMRRGVGGEKGLTKESQR